MAKDEATKRREEWNKQALQALQEYREELAQMTPEERQKEEMRLKKIRQWLYPLEKENM